MFYSTNCPSPFDRVTLASDGENPAGLRMEGQKYFGEAVSPAVSRR